MVVKIIGGGPAGLWAAKHLGDGCTVYEEHTKIGKPVHCTGLVSKRMDALLKLPKGIVLNRIRGARTFSNDGQLLELSRGREEAYVIDRARFDSHLAGLARDAGAKIILGQKAPLLDNRGTTIAADGAASATRRSLGIQLETIPSIQYIAKSTFEEPDFVELHFLNKEFFAWVVPEDGRTARVGVAGPRCKEVLDGFVQRRLKRFRIVERQAGLVVVGGPLSRTVFGNVMLVGDAAGQVKATTGGGIITGMICAEEAAKNASNPQEYERAWRARVGHELKMARMVRSFLSRFGPEDYNTLLDFGERNMDLIRTYGDMDFHSRMVWEIAKRPSNWPSIAGLLLKGIFYEKYSNIQFSISLI